VGAQKVIFSRLKAAPARCCGNFRGAAHVQEASGKKFLGGKKRNGDVGPAGYYRKAAGKADFPGCAGLEIACYRGRGQDFSKLLSPQADQFQPLLIKPPSGVQDFVSSGICRLGRVCNQLAGKFVEQQGVKMNPVGRIGYHVRMPGGQPVQRTG